MNVTDQLINIALLGTATRELIATDLPEELQDSLRDIQEKAEDAETAFYQLSALGFAFRRAGLKAYLLKDPVSVSEAPEESKACFSREVGELLTSLHSNRNSYLLLYAYRKAIAFDKLLPPVYLPALLQRAFDRNNPKRHEEQRWLSELSGRRGRWLLSEMGLPVWGEPGNESWETASHEERKRMLCRLRQEQPEQGLALLQTELKNESAAHREELIRCLRIGLTKADEAFLQELLLKDRSGSVKETARRLLCSLPDSELVKTYQELLRGKLHFNFLSGWSYDKIEYTPEMKKLGFEEVSANKDEKDDRFLLRQLAERVPLSFWSEFYDCTPEKAAGKLAKKPPFQKLFDLSSPILNFGDSVWAYYTLKENAEEDMSLALAGLLSPSQREEIAFQTIKGGLIPDSWFNEDGGEWGMKFSSYVLQRLLRNNYYLPKETAEQLAVYFPAEMRGTLERIAASVTKQENNTTFYFCRLVLEYMDVKQKIDTLIK
ncbi:DUF5691 domain-containing protein [Bacteroides acidifaciens]|uniref:DUF5691 domain-containing protein n=1 Tax=Bacteroides acidifaciens TaxID=85831 RepID=UPI00242D744D|nr:DUF5691 domain-containing protein [Bacteroides acidifaciens]